MKKETLNTQRAHSNGKLPRKVQQTARLSDRVLLLILVCIAGLGVIFLWRATPYGLGLVNDSAAYVGGAENLLAGNGYTRTSGGGELKPITHFPPLYSLLLASLRFTGMEFIEIAHVLNLFFFGLAIVLTGWLVYVLTNSKILAAFTAFLLACSDTILGVYVYLLSEPLFVALLLMAMLAFGKYFTRRKIRWLVFIGAILGLAYLTRFAALSLIAAFVLTLALVARPRSLLRAGFWRPAAALLAGALPFLLSWSVYNYFITGVVGNRQLIIHPIPAETLFNGVKNLLAWLAPKDLLSIHPVFGWGLSGLSLILPFILAGTILAIYLSKRRDVPADVALLAVVSSHILGYMIFLAASISLFDASTPLDDRILLVIYIPEMIFLAACLSFVLRKIPKGFSSPGKYRKWVRGLVTLVCLGLAVFSVRDGLSEVDALSRDGLGFNHSGWRTSPILAKLQELPPLILYSNRSTALYLLTGKSAYVIPTPVDPATTLERPNFEADLAEMRERVQNGDAALVLFSMKTDPETAELYSIITKSLPVLLDTGRDQIFAAPQSTNP